VAFFFFMGAFYLKLLIVDLKSRLGALGMAQAGS